METQPDAYSTINALALQIRKVQNGAISFLAAPARDPLKLTFHLKTIRMLLSDLSRHVYREIPQSIYSQHYRTTEKLEEQLVSLQAGYSIQINNTVNASVRGRRHHIPTEDLKRLIRLGYTDRELGKRFKCDKKTVYRRRLEMGMYRQAYMNSTPDEVLRKV